MTDATADKSPDKAGRNQWWDVWDQFRKHRGAYVSLWILVVIIALVTFGPMIWPWDKAKTDVLHKNYWAFWSCFGEDTVGSWSCFFPGAEARPKGVKFDWWHLLGTDHLGRDNLARLMAGGRISLAVGLLSMLVAVFIGTAIGIVAGYFRKLDGMLMRLADMFLSLPLLPLLLVLAYLYKDSFSRALGPETGVFVLIISAIGVTSWMTTSRIVRGEVLVLKEKEFVLAARSVGTRSGKMIVRHIVPNVLSPVMVSATLGIAGAIITESVLSFLGQGFPPDFPTWGSLLFEQLDYKDLYPMRAFLPGILISLTVLSVNYIGDGLRDALDPKIRGR